MIVVPAQSQVNGNVPEQFFQLTFGRVSSYGDQSAARIVNALMAVSGLGNIVVFTYTAARGEWSEPPTRTSSYSLRSQ
jgi:hypothetical protein